MKHPLKKSSLFFVTALLLSSCTLTLARPSSHDDVVSSSEATSENTGDVLSSQENSLSSEEYASSDKSAQSTESSSVRSSSSSVSSSSSSQSSSQEVIEAVPYSSVTNTAWPTGNKTYRVKPVKASGDSVTVYDVRYTTKGYLAYPTTLTITKDDYCLTYETVALYYMAFRSFPKNYLSISNKKQVTKGSDLRCVSTYYKGTSHTYDYTVKLGTFKNEINGTYYEFDIALDSSYSGSSRGAARLVVVEEGLAEYNGDGPVCYYTKDHYADFCEFYNYAGGWSEEFAGVYNKSGSYSNSPEVDTERPTPTTITPTYLSLS